MFARFVSVVLTAVAFATMMAWAAQPSWDVALHRLKEGNARYVQGANRALSRAEHRPQKLNQMQAPFAMVLGCADSRVAPELAFDQPWGRLFTMRVAGNIAEPYLIGSMEYAVLTFHTPLLVVLGHDNCGAVSAAVNGSAVSGNLKTVIDDIVPAVRGVQGKKLDAAIDANVRHAMAQIQSSSPVIADAVKAGKLHIVGGVYTFKTGKVRWLQ